MRVRAFLAIFIALSLAFGSAGRAYAKINLPGGGAVTDAVTTTVSDAAPVLSDPDPGQQTPTSDAEPLVDPVTTAASEAVDATTDVLAETADPVVDAGVGVVDPAEVVEEVSGAVAP